MDNTEKHIIKYSEILPIAIEAMIDARCKYLKELDYENHRHARSILEKEYKPAVKFLKDILEKIA